MARRGAFHLTPTLISLILLVLVLGCNPSTARPPSDTSTHHHHGHHHEHHHAHHSEEEEGTKEVTEPPEAIPPKSLEIGDVDQEDDEEVTINDADYYFGDDADLLTAAAGAVEVQLKAEEEATRRKAGTRVSTGEGAISLSGGEDGADNATSDGMTEGGALSNSPAKQQKETRGSQEAPHVDGIREMRLNAIKNTILTLLRPPALSTNRSIPLTTPVQRHFIAQVYERMSHVPQWPSTDLYTEKIQSFYPSCEVPRNTDEEMWHGPNVMNLLFNLTLPSTLDGSTISIVAAKLRLFKLSQGNGTSGSNSDGCPPSSLTPSPSPSPSATETESNDGLAVEVVPAADEPVVGPPASPLLGHHSSVSGMLRLSSTALQQDDRRIRVSIYWYTRALKKHRAVKRKLLDSQMVSVVGQEEWVEFDVRFAARYWMESGRNFGLVVEIEDDDGTVLPAERYFAAMNCSKEASTSRPFPGFLFDAAREAGGVGAGSRGNAGSGVGSKSNGGNVGAGMGSGSRALGLDTHLFPLMDLCTIQYPEGEEAPPLSLLPSLSSPNAFGLPFGRRPSLPSPHAPPVVMVACGGAGSGAQRQIVPVIHPSGGRHRHHRRPEEKAGNNTKTTEERGNKKKSQDKDEDNDAVATNQLSQKKEDGDAIVEDPMVESPSAIQVTKIRHPRRHLDGGHNHRTREGRWAIDRERADVGRDGNEEEEDEEVREEKVSWQDEEGRQHVKRKVVVHKTIVSHREGEAVEEEDPEVEQDEGRSIAVMDHRGR